MSEYVLKNVKNVLKIPRKIARKAHLGHAKLNISLGDLRHPYQCGALIPLVNSVNKRRDLDLLNSEAILESSSTS